MGDRRDQPALSEFAESPESTTQNAAADSPLGTANPDSGHKTSEMAPMDRPAGVQQQQQHQHQLYSNGSYGFSAQLDIPSQHGHGQAGPFNMRTMAGALPHAPYQPSPYTPGQQPSYHSLPGPPSHMANQMISHYDTQGNRSGWIGNQQQYSVPQHIGQYYGPPISPSPQVSLPHRADYGYHSSNVIVGQQQQTNTSYYYQPGTFFAGQGPQAHGQTMPEHYATPGTQLGVARSMQSQYGAQGPSTINIVGRGNGKLIMLAHILFG